MGPKPDLSLSTEGAASVITLGGPPDLATLPALMAMLADVMADHEGVIIVDLSRSRFIDSATARALGEAAESQRARGGRVLLRSPSTQTLRLVTGLGLADLVEPDGLTPAKTPRSARFGISIGRQTGIVVVSVHGELDAQAARYLGAILADLIDGQGNLSLVVGLANATATDVDSLAVLATAAERARKRGGSLTLTNPGAVLAEALRRSGLDHLVGTVPGGDVDGSEPAAAVHRRDHTAHPVGRDRPANPTRA